MLVDKKKYFLLFIKYFPIVQMMGILVNNVIYINYNTMMAYVIDYSIGTSLAVFVLLYLISYTFKFCLWHRLIITSNLFSSLIALYDSYANTSRPDNITIIMVWIINCFFIILATLSHLREKQKDL